MLEIVKNSMVSLITAVGLGGCAGPTSYHRNYEYTPYVEEFEEATLIVRLVGEPTSFEENGKHVERVGSPYALAVAVHNHMIDAESISITSMNLEATETGVKVDLPDSFTSIFPEENYPPGHENELAWIYVDDLETPYEDYEIGFTLVIKFKDVSFEHSIFGIMSKNYTEEESKVLIDKIKGL